MSTLKVSTLQNASSATANITLDTAGNATVGGTLAMGSSFLRNRIINGGMQIWQRGTSFTNVGSGAPPTYTVDRWFGYRGGFAANMSVFQQTGFSGFQYCARVQRANGDTSTQSIQFCQIIENLNMYDLANLPVTISFYARTAPSGYSGGQLTIIVPTGTGNDQGSFAFANGTWTGGGSAITVSQTLTSTATRYTFTGICGAGINEMAIQFLWTPTGTAGSTDYIEITGVQLEVGSVATPFERRQFGQELMLCQRYYLAGNTISILGYGTSGGFAGNMVFFPVTMRASPTIVQTNTFTFNCSATPTQSVISNTGFQSARSITATGNVQFNETYTAAAEL